MEVLRRAFEQNDGKMPSRALRYKLARQLNLKQKQVYKWFWELKKQQAGVATGDGIPKLDGSDDGDASRLERMTDLQKLEAYISGQNSIKKHKLMPRILGIKGLQGTKLT